nr:hypothetical protein [uncultured Flavobacterium sp.]
MSEIKPNNTVEANEEFHVMYEYLQVRATVINFTNQDMILTGSDLSWGKWINSPVDTPRSDTSTFGSQGRDSSPSGTTGWATWKIGNAIITVNFDCPLNGSNSQSITCEPKGAFNVSATGTGGNVNICSFKILPV